MAGRKSGVQARIKEIEPKALFNHCHGHLLNLACADNIKQNEALRNALDTAYEITNLVKKSPQRETKLEQLCRAAAADIESFRDVSSTLRFGHSTFRPVCVLP
jgi:hypothetical protein